MLLLQQPADLLHALVEAGAAVVEAHAEAGEFVRQDGTCETNVETAVAQRVGPPELELGRRTV